MQLQETKDKTGINRLLFSSSNKHNTTSYLTENKSVLKIPAGAAFLHNFCSVISWQLAKSIIAVDNGPIHYLGITQDKISICLKEHIS